MMLVRRLSLVLALVTAFLVVAPGWSSTLMFSSFGPGESFGTGTQSYQVGSSGFDTQQQLAIAFTATFTGTFHSVRLAGNHNFGVNDFSVVLAAGNSGLPGAAIEEISGITLTESPDVGVTTVVSTAQSTLSQGVAYWIILAATDPANTGGGWSWGSGVSGTFAVRNSFGPGWFLSPLELPSLAVYASRNDGPEVPEPSTALLVGALALLVCRSRGVALLR